MSLALGSERQTSRAAIAPGPSLWRQTPPPFYAALREGIVKNNANTMERLLRCSRTGVTKTIPREIPPGQFFTIG